jgi:hypothetical protein
MDVSFIQHRLLGRKEAKIESTANNPGPGTYVS